MSYASQLLLCLHSILQEGHTSDVLHLTSEKSLGKSNRDGLRLYPIRLEEWQISCNKLLRCLQVNIVANMYRKNMDAWSWKRLSAGKKCPPFFVVYMSKITSKLFAITTTYYPKTSALPHGYWTGAQCLLYHPHNPHTPTKIKYQITSFKPSLIPDAAPEIEVEEVHKRASMSANWLWKHTFCHHNHLLS